MDKMPGAVKNSQGGVSTTAREIEFSTVNDIFSEAKQPASEFFDGKLGASMPPPSTLVLKPEAPRPRPKGRPMTPVVPPSIPVNTAPLAQPSEPQPQAPGPATQETDPLMLLGELFENAPSPEQIQRWKQTYGAVYMLPLSDDEVYLWRPIKRSEWKNLLGMIKQAKGANAELDAEELLNERLCEKCILWPSVSAEWATFSKAGTVPTIAEAIRQSSNFVPLELAMRMVRKIA